MLETKPTHHTITKIVLSKLITKVIKINRRIMEESVGGNKLVWDIVKGIENNEELLEKIPYMGSAYMVHAMGEKKLIPRPMGILRTSLKVV